MVSLHVGTLPVERELLSIFRVSVAKLVPFYVDLEQFHALHMATLNGLPDIYHLYGLCNQEGLHFMWPH